MNSYCETLEKARAFVKRLTNKTANKALTDLARALTSACFESDTDIDEFISSYDEDEIFDPNCLFGNHDNVYDFVLPKYRKIAKILFEYRPIGLGTPQAMVGEGELMCLAMSPRVGIAKKKNTGDITVDDSPIEMKGEQVRIMGDITGIELQTRAKSLAKEFGIKPNTCTRNRKAYEPWGMSPSKISHWQNEFKEIGKPEAVEFLSLLFDAPKARFTGCWTDGWFDAELLNKVILKMLFRQMEKLWEAFTIIESDGRIVSITADPDEFDRMVDDDVIYVTGDYIRSFQPVKIGLYCKRV